MPKENEKLDEQNAASRTTPTANGTAPDAPAPAGSTAASDISAPAVPAGTPDATQPAASDKNGAAKSSAKASAKDDPDVKLTRKGVSVFRKKSEIEPLLAVGWKIAER